MSPNREFSPRRVRLSNYCKTSSVGVRTVHEKQPPLSLIASVHPLGALVVDMGSADAGCSSTILIFAGAGMLKDDMVEFKEHSRWFAPFYTVSRHDSKTFQVLHSSLFFWLRNWLVLYPAHMTALALY
jgi:hypothetical protein